MASRSGETGRPGRGARTIMTCVPTFPNDSPSAKDPTPASETSVNAAEAAPRPRFADLLVRPFDVRSISLTGLFILAVFYTMYFTRSFLLPIVLSLLLMYLLRPVVRFLGKLKLKPPLASAIVLLSLVGVIGWSVSLLAAPAASWVEKAPYSMQQLKQKLVPLRQRMARVSQASTEIEKIAAPDPAAGAPAPAAVEVKQHPLTDTLYGRTPELAMDAVLLLILLYFLLAYDGMILTKVIKLTPRLADKKRAVSIAHDIETHVSRYLLTITLINLSLGIAVGAAVGFLGLKNPIMWGVMVALLNFIPYLGALSGIICMTLGAVLSYDSFGYAMIFPAVYLTLATLEGNFVTPFVMGRSLTLNPIMILLSLTFWGWMWGIAGVILAVPILAAFKIFCSHVEPLEPVAEFLS